MWRFVSQIIFLLEEGEQPSFLFCVSIYLLKIWQNKTVMVTMVFTSTICYTMVPQLLALHLITSPFVRRERRSLEPLQSNLSALDWKFGVWDLELLLFFKMKKRRNLFRLFVRGL